MKFIIAVLQALALVVCVAYASPTPIRRDHRHILVNRPTKEDMFNARVRRSDPLGVKGRPFPIPVPVRKGEYECGNKICKLKPGEKPAGCIGCQYPIDISDFIKKNKSS